MLMMIVMPELLWPCSCGRLKPACAYWGADAIFLGRVSFTDDNGTGTFTQATLVRFDVEERFKGVAPDVKQVWIDPESFSSCYAEYKLGTRYLMFASRVSLNATFQRGKPLPEGFDIERTIVYRAGECTGSHEVDGFPNLDRDFAMLRAYRAGQTMPRVLGHLALYPFGGWPTLGGPGLKGARVKIANDSGSYETMTDSQGNFSLQNAEPGKYKAWAELPPLRQSEAFILDVPTLGCGYADIRLATATTVRGVVLKPDGWPAAKLDVYLRSKETGIGREFYLSGRTDDSGQFEIAGMPDQEVYLSAGDDLPRSDWPYERGYYPIGSSLKHAQAFRLTPGEHAGPMVLWLGKALPTSRVKVRAVQKNGEPAADAVVRAFGSNGNFAEGSRTDQNGNAIVPCVLGYRYEMDAMLWRPDLPTRDRVSMSPRKAASCGGSAEIIQLVVDAIRYPKPQ